MKTLLSILLLTTTALGADDHGFVVIESSEVSVKPTRLEIDLSIGSEAEMSSDAVTKYRQSGRTVVDALKSLGIKNLKIENRGLEIATTSSAAMPMVMPGAQATPSKTAYRAGGTVRVSITDLSGMSEQQIAEAASKILDVAKDNGAKANEPEAGNFLAMAMGGRGQARPAVRFIVEDAAAARDQAFGQAFKKAQARAQRWADATGAKLGKLTGLEEQAAAEGAAANQVELMMAMQGMGKTAAGEGRLSSNSLGAMPVKVTIKARFAVN